MKMSNLPNIDKSLRRNSKIPWCPACGSAPISYNGGVCCSMKWCALHTVLVQESAWRELCYKVWKDDKDLRGVTTQGFERGELVAISKKRGEVSARKVLREQGYIPFYFDYVDEFPTVINVDRPRKGWKILTAETQVVINSRAVQRGVGLPKEEITPRERIDEWDGRLQALARAYDTEAVVRMRKPSVSVTPRSIEWTVVKNTQVGSENNNSYKNASEGMTEWETRIMLIVDNE